MRVPWMTVVLLGLAFPFGAEVRAQQQPFGPSLDSTKEIDQYVHDVWTVEDGLPSSSILDIVQTRDGYLWLATTRGLVRFDGARFAVFDASNTPALSSNTTEELLEARDGSLWIGAEGAGLVQYRAGQFTLYAVGAGLVGNVRSLAEDETGTLWVVAEGTLQLFRDGKFSVFSIPDSIAPTQVRFVVADRQGGMWFTSDRGLYRFKEGVLELFTAKDGLRGFLRGLYADAAGGVWIEAERNGWYWFRDGKVLHQEASHVAGMVSANPFGRRGLLRDRRGTLWLGDDLNLRRLVEGESGAAFARTDILSDRVRVIYEDREGGLWVGTYDGLHRFMDGAIVTRRLPSPRGVVQAADGSLWAGNKGGISRYGETGWSSNRLEERVIDVGALAADGEEGIWVGAHGGRGLYRYSASGTRLPTPGGLGESGITLPAVGPDGTLWVATYVLPQTRLHVLVDGRFVRVASLAATPKWIHEDRSGTLWLGARDGLFRLESGQFTRAFEEHTTGVNIRHVYEDDSGVLWIGTLGRGLLRISRGEIMRFSMADGLFDNTILGIVGDHDRHLWMSSDHGIFAISLDDIAAYERGEIEALRSLVFGRPEGMISAEAIGTGHPTAARLDDGTLAFTVVGGVAIFDPAELLVSHPWPTVLIEEVLANGQPVGLAANSALSADQRRIDFRYTAVALSHPERVRLKHRLVGFDEDWIDAGTSRTAHYTNLPPGDYEFRVVAGNRLGEWSETGSAVAFSIPPFFHETLWFRVMVLLLLVGVISLVFRGRLRLALARAAYERQQREKLAVLNESLKKKTRQLITAQDDERCQISQEIHDGVNQQLSLLAVRLDVAAAQLPQGEGADVAAAADGARTVATDLQRLSRRLHPAHLEQLGLEGALQALCRDGALGFNGEVTFRNGTSVSLSSEQAVALYRITQEALQNVVKHSMAERAAITLRDTADGVRLTIEDEGVGFDPTHSGEGIGLTTMDDRSRAVGATFRVISAPGRGTHVIVDMPLKPTNDKNE